MRIRGMSHGLTFAAATLASLALPPRVSACSDSACAFQTDQTTLRADLYDAPCDRLKIGELDQTAYGPDVRAPGSFVRGACIFERISRNLPVFASTEGSGMGPIESGIDELQKAQSTALLAAQRTTASLLEGLLHCRRLRALASEPATRERRGFHRSAAKASFAAVDLAGFTLKYEERDGDRWRTEPARLETVLNEMISCQTEQLHARETASCGMLLSPSTQELDTLVAKTADEVLPRYIGSTAKHRDEPHDPASPVISAPPVTAMLLRRIREAEAASTGAEDAFATLQRKNARIKDNQASLALKLCMGDPAGCIPAAAQAVYAAYNAAIATASTYAAFAQQVMEGLLLDENKQDVGARVATNLEAARAQATKLDALRAPLEALRSELARLSLDAQGTAATREACALLFCEIYPRPGTPNDGSWLSEACRKADPESPTGESLRRTNPLCQTTPAQQRIVGVGDGSVTATSVCREAGFDPASDCSTRD